MLNVEPKQSVKSAISQANPLVSVVLGNYNYGRFLQQSIDSVFNQTYQNFELIVVDDGSTDNSEEIIKSYGSRIIAILQENSGQEATFNAGIQRATGEIICFLDADDYFHEEKLEKVVNSFLTHPEWVMVGHCWISVNKEGKPVGSGASNILSQGDVKKLLLKWGKYASSISSGLACKHSYLEKVMPLSKGWGVDAYLNAALPFYGKVGSINEPLMFYRMHGNNMRAYCDNLTYLMQQRENTARFINEVAVKVGESKRFELQRDVDYRSYKVMQEGGAPLTEKLQIIWLSLQESIAIRRSLRDTLIRLIYRSICTLFPQEGKLILRFGLRGYFNLKLGGGRWKK
ncbi:MAG: glycosyltransferase [Cyanomargarita calcarea GSE-NOS-MK-12-04C]|jgi:glycosyltransferase involved in cell wall biosynthesis|uniref:Glycosyltransferase n=1 Tax=Cyanomargarita calcarea GSE-NOS-MK-12-04C TaxID=2839659 RepID=A0A951QS12_9CYAN|nr:glycosyltransferase [Cyanomargarita calcarea GSE-NOS-MK-12-04C]